MKKILLFLIGLTVSVHAYTYNTQLMQVYAKIAPRLVLMTQSKADEPDKAITISIVYEQGDKASAEQLRDAMLQNYPDGLKERELDIVLTPYARSLTLSKSTLLFLLDTDEKVLKPTLKFAAQHNIPTMSYSNRFLQEGVILSLHLGKTVRPYLNLEAAKKNHIGIDNLLIQISKIYTPERAQ